MRASIGVSVRGQSRKPVMFKKVISSVVTWKSSPVRQSYVSSRIKRRHNQRRWKDGSQDERTPHARSRVMRAVLLRPAAANCDDSGRCTLPSGDNDDTVDPSHKTAGTLATWRAPAPCA